MSTSRFTREERQLGQQELNLPEWLGVPLRRRRPALAAARERLERLLVLPDGGVQNEAAAAGSACAGAASPSPEHADDSAGED